MSEYRREEILGNQHNPSGTVFEEQTFVPVESTTNAENAPSTLPQILHLSYKNRGQYHLNVLRARITEDDDNNDAQKLEDIKTQPQVVEGAFKALDDFAEALDKDEDDVDLWRRAAKVSSALGSTRTSRFCLEAVLDEEHEGTVDIIGGPGIEAKLALQDLESVEIQKKAGFRAQLTCRS